MSESVVVASREIIDAVYRAARMGGAQDGTASLLGRTTCFAAGQLGRGLAGVVDTFEAGRLPLIGFASVARSLAPSAQHNPVAIEDEHRVGDIAYSALGASQRGLIIHLEVEGELLDPQRWLQPELAEASVSSLTCLPGQIAAETNDRVRARHTEVLREGLAVEAPTWVRLIEIASRYLVQEAAIDAVDNPTT